MNFENEERYRRKPDLVQAVRLTAEGNVPIMHADTHWIKRARADKRLSYTATAVETDEARGLRLVHGTWFANTGNSLQAAYPGDWLVLFESDQRVRVMTDETFREHYEAIPFAEDE